MDKGKFERTRKEGGMLLLRFLLVSFMVNIFNLIYNMVTTQFFMNMKNEEAFFYMNLFLFICLLYFLLFTSIDYVTL